MHRLCSVYAHGANNKTKPSISQVLYDENTIANLATFCSVYARSMLGLCSVYARSMLVFCYWFCITRFSHLLAQAGRLYLFLPSTPISAQNGFGNSETCHWQLQFSFWEFQFQHKNCSGDSDTDFGDSAGDSKFVIGDSSCFKGQSAFSFT